MPKSSPIVKDVRKIMISLDVFYLQEEVFLNQMEYILVCCSKNRICPYCYHNTYLVNAYSKIIIQLDFFSINYLNLLYSYPPIKIQIMINTFKVTKPHPLQLWVWFLLIILLLYPQGAPIIFI